MEEERSKENWEGITPPSLGVSLRSKYSRNVRVVLPQSAMLVLLFTSVPENCIKLRSVYSTLNYTSLKVHLVRVFDSVTAYATEPATSLQAYLNTLANSILKLVIG